MTQLSSHQEQKKLAKWFGLDLLLTEEAVEAAEYALMEAGALGTETGEAHDDTVLVSAYFDQVPDRERVRAELAEALRIYQLPSSSVREMMVREVADQDWLGEWKKNWQPVEVGKRFIIAPPWTELSDAHNRIVIRIEPGMAFGTGTHETTRLCLDAIERYFAGGSFLDVGTGTGILAIAAAKLFPNAHIEACDTDAEAVAIARENARLNGVEKINFRVGTVAEDSASADLVCANLTADVIAPILPLLVSVTCGHLVLSGILDTQVEGIRARLLECGVSEPSETVQDGEWIAIVV
ncbi:MAG TPA: 50S ribosomal protein L11 methyltransferase [Pyrinomonadaceae bacterium]|jgi:ribosomal protein L11 methyltransferase|nr:50S ribosomal protein L11 methyltransferase [Pyrinomonadaceae bacterium]